MEIALTHWLGLGGNLGDVVDGLGRALDALDGGGAAVLTVSGAYRTAPRDDVDQPPFVNAAAAVAFSGDPPGLLDLALDVERRLGRVRTRRFGPRTVDIDLLLWSEGAWNDSRLRIPHPRLHERRFALAPLAEIAPDLVLPDGRTVAAAADALAGDPGQSVERLPGVVLWPPAARARSAAARD